MNLKTFAFILTASSALMACGQENNEPAAATVNGNAIPSSKVEEQLAQVPAELLAGREANIKTQILDQLIQQELILQQAEEINIQSDEAYQSQLQAFEKQLKYNMTLQKYLETGDEKLLNELTYAFQTMVSQEGTIQTYNDWKNIREILKKHPGKSIQVIGCDVVNEYLFPIKHILLLSNDDGNWTQRQVLEKAISQEDLNSTI